MLNANRDHATELADHKGAEPKNSASSLARYVLPLNTKYAFSSKTKYGLPYTLEYRKLEDEILEKPSAGQMDAPFNPDIS